MSNPADLTSKQRYAIIGAGFTLSRTAALFPPGAVVLTARSARSAQDLGLQFPSVTRLAIEDSKAFDAFLSRHSGVRVLVDGTPPLENLTAEQIFEDAKARGVRISSTIDRLIYISTTGVYGVDDGSWVTENSPPHPRFKRGKARLAAEEGYREGLKEKLTVIRVPAIYGPGRGIGTSLKAGRYRLIEGGTRWSNRIEVSDLARAVAAAMQATSLPPVLLLSDGTPAQACDVVDYYCSAFKLPEPLSISEEEAFAAGLETMLSNLRADSAGSWKALGIEPNVKSYKEGAAIEMKTQPPKS